jgi:hypothetical protein
MIVLLMIVECGISLSQRQRQRFTEQHVIVIQETIKENDDV